MSVIPEPVATAAGSILTIISLLGRTTRTFAVSYAEWAAEDRDLILTRPRITRFLIQVQLLQPIISLNIDDTTQTVTITLIPLPLLQTQLTQEIVEKALSTVINRVRRKSS